jgi:outer membrane protein OmpA-like peptidoglycan-associated protein
MGTSPIIQSAERNEEHLSRWPGLLDELLFVVITVAAVYVFVLLSYSLYFQVHTYSNAIQSALSDPNRGDIIALAYARATDFAIVKISVVFLGFILAFLGALYVLRTATASFSLTGSSGTSSASLQTSSPGLVMIVLGVATINCALFARTTVGLDSENAHKGTIQIASVGSPAPTPAKQAVHAEQTRSSEAGLDSLSAANISNLAAITVGSSGPTPEFPPFAANSADLTEKQKRFLADLARKMAKNQDSVQIEAKGEAGEPVEASLALAESRADAIKKFLVQTNLAGDRVKVITYGKLPPDAMKRSRITTIPKK